MFQNILKWTLKIPVDGVEKEFNIHLDADTPLQAVEQVAMQMIAYCAKVKESQAASQKPDIQPPSEPVEQAVRQEPNAAG